MLKLGVRMRIISTPVASSASRIACSSGSESGAMTAFTPRAMNVLKMAAMRSRV